MAVRGGGGKRASAITSPKGQTRDDESAPLHSPKLTQGRAHPAVVYSTPAGERQRPRVRRCHEEKTRGGVSLLLTFISNYETAFQILDTWCLRRGLGAVRHVSLSCPLPHGRVVRPPRRRGFRSIASRPNYLSTTCERRQNLNSYRGRERPFEICWMSRQSVNQHRTRLDDFVEMRIRPLIAGKSESLSNGSGLDLLLGDARSGPCPCPVMKGNGHHCVSLKHAFRPFLEVG
jgi:hypothetical protein